MPFVLDLVRHGHAPAAPPGGADAERRLSPAGRDAIARLAARLRGDGFHPDRILTSPYRRARETATLLREGAAASPEIQPLEELAPEREPSEVVDALATLGRAATHVVLVSHQPLVGRLALHLTGVEQGFHAGTLVRIDFPGALEPGSGRVVRVFDPPELG